MKSYISLVLAALFILTSCNKQKTQKEQYEEMLSSFKYKTYKTASVSTIPPALKAYEEKSGNPAAEADENAIRLLLGYNWAVTSKSEFAFAEADIIDSKKEPGNEFLTRSLRSIVMYENGWDSLARQESDLAIKMASAQGQPQTQLQLGTFYLVMGTMFVHRKDYAQAKFFFAGFGQTTGINWPYQIVDAMNDIDKGNVQQGLKKIKKMTEDPSVPEPVRIALKGPLEEIENTTGDVNSRLFWPKAISSILFKELKNSGDEKLKELGKMMEDISQKVSL